MRLALDTNVLAYAEGVNGRAMKEAALELIAKLPESTTFLAVQVLGELFQVLVRKAGYSKPTARASILSWQDVFPLIETSSAIIFSAMDLASQHDFSIWDGVVVSASAASGCRLLLSEDMQDGFTWSGVTIANPFSKTKHALLEALLAE